MYVLITFKHFDAHADIFLEENQDRHSSRDSSRDDKKWKVCREISIMNFYIFFSCSMTKERQPEICQDVIRSIARFMTYSAKYGLGCEWLAYVSQMWSGRRRRVDISTHDFSPFSLSNETFYDPKNTFMMTEKLPLSKPHNRRDHVDIERQRTQDVIGTEIIEWKLSTSNPQANIITIKTEKVAEIFIWADTWHFHTKSIAIRGYRCMKRVYNCEWMD